ncbi:MAG: ankyrin repeat domain-containing protein [Verrucomicrobiaceae bacterium]
MKWLLSALFFQVLQATPLVDAAHRNDLAEVTRLLEAGAAAGETNRYGVSPLSLACQSGNVEMIRVLLAKGADANAALKGGESPLMTASRTGVLDAVKVLVEAGAKLEAREHRGQTALMWATAEGHLEVVRFLVDEGADFRTPLQGGFTPMLLAVREGHIDLVREFLKRGVDVNEAAKPKRAGGKRLREGSTPLMVAVENGHFDLGVVLLEAGANPNDQGSGFAPLHALTWVRKSVKGDGDDGLPTPKGSGMMGSLEFARALVKHGADPDLKLDDGRGGVARVDRKGATAFLMAAEAGDLEFLKVLIELGADASMGNRGGTVPLLAAAGMGVTAPGEEAASVEEAMEVVRFLVEMGADINLKDRRGETVMHAAAYKSAPKMMELLDELGADIAVWNQKNKSGWTPLLITQGFRPGNFRPIETSERALAAIMRKHGAEVPPAPKRKKIKGYQDR